ncbi:hypothetical protein DFQ27_001986 [Actinomortierella ambigua]|uniref:DUF6589 domain-containing protein n=1 Tax=Actinomortierella ambigua TaxID=1343610 RepID=A0A9P6PKJ9_9FUNG|nr:hypothetical protein DFQ27_001986 [Actinomortierella ambigua]
MLQDARTPRYAAELLRLTYLMREGWTPEWKRTALSSMFVNPTGRDDGFIPTDQYQEQNIRLIKDMYMPNNSTMSWQYLISSITPIIRLLTTVRANLEKEFKTPFNSNKRAPVEIHRDVCMILNVFRKFDVLAGEDKKTKPSKDLLNAGLKKLQSQNGLERLEKAYNSEYVKGFVGQEDDDEEEVDEEDGEAPGAWKDDDKAMDMLDDDFSHELFSYLPQLSTV